MEGPRKSEDLNGALDILRLSSHLELRIGEKISLYVGAAVPSEFGTAPVRPQRCWPRKWMYEPTCRYR